jgi:vanillate monooxygenase ferredoxin subunit
LAEGKPFSLQYFTRSPDHTAFRTMLRLPSFTEHLHLFYALDPEAVKKYLRTTLWHRPPGGHLYICGPGAFMDVVEEIASHTWPPEAVHTEYFSADPKSLAGPKEAFEVVLSRSGVTVEVKEGQTIVDALAAKGIMVDVSCQQGICGTCLTGVLEGEPDHRDTFLTEGEKRTGQKIMPCVSRALGPRLVLDL